MMTYQEYCNGIDELIYPDEAADLLRTNMNQMYKILKSGDLHAFRQGRRWLIPKRAIHEYILSKSGINKSW